MPSLVAWPGVVSQLSQSACRSVLPCQMCRLIVELFTDSDQCTVLHSERQKLACVQPRRACCSFPSGQRNPGKVGCLGSGRHSPPSPWTDKVPLLESPTLTHRLTHGAGLLLCFPKLITSGSCPRDSRSCSTKELCVLTSVANMDSLLQQICIM